MTLQVALYSQLSRTLTPCTGIGRHCNEVGLALSRRTDVGISLIVSEEHVSEKNELPLNAPLRALSHKAFSMSDAISEKYRKLTGRSVFDPVVPRETDWLYCPHETRLNSQKCNTAITIHDARMFEPDFEDAAMRYRAANFVLRSWMRKAAKEANLVFTVSNFSKGRLCELLELPERKVIAVGNGLTKTFASALTLDSVKFKRYRARDTVIVMGGLRRLKGGDLVLELAQSLINRGSNIRILSIGGPDEPDLIRRAEELKNIERLGFVSDDALVELLAGALSMLTCSRYEGFGLPVLEAMAVGAPVIAHNGTSLPEVVGDGGVLIDSVKTEAIADTLERLQKDTTYFDGLVSKGRLRAAEFSWDNVARRIVEAMLEHTSSSRGGKQKKWDS